jgi:hypothetical protein
MMGIPTSSTSKISLVSENQVKKLISSNKKYFLLLLRENHIEDESIRVKAVVVGAGCDLTKHLTLWVTYHNCTKEGWDLTNVYRLQSIEKKSLKNM